MNATAAFLAQAAETTTETAETFHMTFGEMLVSVTTLLLTLVTVGLVFVSVKLVKVTTMAANAEMAKVSINANDDMRDVAKAAMIAPTPKPPTYAPRGHAAYRETRKVVTAPKH